VKESDVNGTESLTVAGINMISWFGSLALLVIGAVVGMLVERHRWKRSRRDKLDEAKQRAIVAALAWIDPMYSALMSAESQMYALLKDEGQIGGISDQEFRQTYPDLLRALVKLDLSPEHRLLVPSDTYERGNRIQHAFDQLKYETLDLWEKTRYPLHSPVLNTVDARLQSSQRISALRKHVDDLRKDLESAYQKTYQ
jgi:hypothetical protein